MLTHTLNIRYELHSIRTYPYTHNTAALHNRMLCNWMQGNQFVWLTWCGEPLIVSPIISIPSIWCSNNILVKTNPYLKLPQELNNYINIDILFSVYFLPGWQLRKKRPNRKQRKPYKAFEEGTRGSTETGTYVCTYVIVLFCVAIFVSSR